MKKTVIFPFLLAVTVLSLPFLSCSDNAGEQGAGASMEEVIEITSADLEKHNADFYALQALAREAEEYYDNDESDEDEEYYEEDYDEDYGDEYIDEEDEFEEEESEEEYIEDEGTDYEGEEQM